MFRPLLLCLALTISSAPSLTFAQASESPAATVESEPSASAADSTEATVKKETGELIDDTKKHVDSIARQVDLDPRAHEISAGILKPIYQLAEFLSFSAFHWVAFACMVAGVVSYAFQLVLGKLVVLSKMSLSPSEILSDVLGLVISVVGLVLTTQAAAENSTFTQSPAAVISSAVVGALAGLVFYRWGQAQEIQAVAGRNRVIAPPR